MNIIKKIYPFPDVKFSVVHTSRRHLRQQDRWDSWSYCFQDQEAAGYNIVADIP